MKTEVTYQGWTNYATWRVNLELFYGYEFEDSIIEDFDTYDFSKYLEELAEDWSTCNCENEIAKDYCLAFLAQVNYYEIAQSILEDYKNYAK
jgi:hypothetical protein